MDVKPKSWILMTDQQKGLENAIKNEVLHAEHRLCVKHLHANWSKRFLRKMFFDMMWKCARAANVPYFETSMEKIKNVSSEAYDALNRIDIKNGRGVYSLRIQTALSLLIIGLRHSTCL
ncbi:hypothetical protein LIER_09025 [Lithospermum erythrorhizon]|uniref:Protein FAR1-RELATED SEQUENCE n=1 Tax=Lithospermum erythrorhizon TaxID=34254 RepID=A0AAV3PE92_LITER